MPGNGWQIFENEVRELARLSWGTEPQSREVAGVKLDCLLVVKNNYWVVIEITKNNTLDKIRGDINRLALVRSSCFGNNIFAECFIVLPDAPTPSMVTAGKDVHVKVLSKAVFQRLFFDHKEYAQARQALQFGSAVDPLTGKPDRNSYVPVSYARKSDGRRMDLDGIVRSLGSGGTIILTGEYGSGKSRCVKEVFESIAKAENVPLLLSIDLRRSWGLQTGAEIIRRHLEEVGMSAAADNIVRAFNDGRVTCLLDGFDEIGAQSWSKAAKDLQAVRFATLKGVRDIVAKSKQGVLICGREHYFNSTDEMLVCLGLKATAAVVLRCEDQFTEEEMEQFLDNIGQDIVLPEWLPRRPLMCQAVASLDDASRVAMFDSVDADVEFWHSFMEIVCRREAQIKDILWKEAILEILKRLGRVTRSKPENLGPISFFEIQRAFESVVGQPPTDESLVILQRLPGLGLVGSGSDDRKFIDIFILDGLRATDISDAVRADDRAMFQELWLNPLENLGQRILAIDIQKENGFAQFRGFLLHSTSGKNGVVGGDILSSTVRSLTAVDLRGIELQEAIFSELDLENCNLQGLRLGDSLISQLILPRSPPKNVEIVNCQIGKIFGITDKRALPDWIKSCEISELESAENVSRIKAIHLSNPHRILVTILKKCFLQKGAGRQEAALLRGLGQIDRRGNVETIIKILKREGLVKVVPGDHGVIFVPERKYTDRVKKIIAELSTSHDQIWLEVGEL